MSIVSGETNSAAANADPIVANPIIANPIIEGIITPEAVVLELEMAGIASRAFAGAIDVLIQIVLYFVLLLVFALLVASAGGASDGVLQAAAGILVFAVIFFYPLLSEMLTRGRTIGKSAMGLRVVTIEGAPIRFRHAAVRAMGGLVDKWVPPGGLVGVFFVLGTPNRQRIGDLLAGTIVIRDPDRTALPAGIWFPVPPGFEAYAATIDPTAFTVDHYTIVRSLLMRTRQLTPAARYSVALDLADRTERILHHQRPADVHPETFLLCVIARYQRRSFPQYQPTAWNPR